MNILKAIFFILGTVIVVELFFALKTFLTPVDKPQPEKIFPISFGQLILVSDKNNYQVSDEIIIKVEVSTGGKTTDGLDLSLYFDPQLLEIKSDFFQKGSIYSEYSQVETDPNGGLIRVSATALPEAGFSGVGEFASFKFKAKKDGVVVFNIDFQKGRTTDSNIIESGTSKDILEKVSDLEISIGDFPKKNNVEKDECSGYKQVCQDEKGMMGAQQCFGGSKISGICSFDPILTTSCTSCQVLKN